MSYTDIDIRNATTYASQRLRLLYINYLYKHKPHLATHFKYTIRRADINLDYYYPPGFERNAIMVDVQIPQNLCELLSCNSAKSTGVCTENDEATVERIGTDRFLNVCQPACFNLNSVIAHDSDNVAIPHSTAMMWNASRQECQLFPANLFNLDFPILRSTEMWETRVNDLPLGFNRTPNDRWQTGFEYNFNEPYCEAFFDVWNPSLRSCVPSPGMFALGAVFGASLIKNIQEGIRLVSNGKHEFRLPDNLPTIPILEAVYERTNWLNNINTDFVDPSPYQQLPDGDQYIEERGQVLAWTNAKEVELVGLRKRQRFYWSRSLAKEAAERLNMVINEPRRYMAKKRDQLPKERTDGPRSAGTVVLEALTDFHTNHDFLSAVLVSFGVDYALAGARKIATKIMEKNALRLVELVMSMGAKTFSSTVMRGAINATSAVTVRTIVQFTVGSFVKSMVGLMKVATSIFGWILAISMALDLLFTFWDPAGFNQKYSKEQLDQIIYSIEMNLRNEVGRQNLSLEFEDVLTFLIPSEEVSTINVEMFIFIHDYLDALTVNSEGTRIDRGEDLSNMTLEEAQFTSNAFEAHNKMYSATDVYNYEFDHGRRMEWFKNGTPLAVVLGTIGVGFLLADFTVLGVVFLILAICLVFTLYLNAATVNLGVHWDNMIKDLNLIGH